MTTLNLETAPRDRQIIYINSQIPYNTGEDIVRASQLINKPVWSGDLEIGTVKEVIVDTEEWKVTHLEIQLKKEASKEILGAKK